LNSIGQFLTQSFNQMFFFFNLQDAKWNILDILLRNVIISRLLLSETYIKQNINFKLTDVGGIA